MKVIADQNIPFVKEAFAEFGEVFTLPGRDIDQTAIKDAAILLVRSVTKVDELLLKESSIKFVGTATIGTDHIDKTYLAKNFIGFSNASGSNANSVAEYIIAALIQLAKMKNLDLKKCTLGIIGVGNIGSIVFQKCTALGISCLLNDPPKKKLTQSHIYLPLEEVLNKSDIVTIHVPLTKDGVDKTYHMVNSHFINKMKKNAILINTSRGKVIDEKELSQKVEQKQLELVLDVWENEPNIDLNLLPKIAIATPHIAGYSYESKIKGTGMIHQSTCAFFFKKPQWEINSILKQLPFKTIDFSKVDNPVNEAIFQAYSIMNDDHKLRKITTIEKNKQGNYFDNLRKNYPKRHEFSRIKLSAQDLTPDQQNILKNIGFALVEKARKK